MSSPHVSKNVEILTSPGQDHIATTIPLAEAAGPWTGRYLEVARAEKVPAEVLELPEGLVIQVSVPIRADRDSTFRILDAAVGLVEKAKAADSDQQGASATTQGYVREWWSRQRA